MIKILSGEETYLKDDYLRKMIKLELPELNLSRHDRIDSDLYCQYHTMPVIDEKRVLICHALEIDENILQLIADDNVTPSELYIITDKVDERKGIYKSLKSKKCIISFDKLLKHDLKKFILNIIKEEGGSIKEDLLTLMIEKINYYERPGCSLHTIETFVRQCLFTKKEIDICALDNIDGFSSDIFSIMKFIRNRDIKIHALLNRLIDNKENPIAMLSLIFYHYRLSYKLTLFQGSPSSLIIKELGITQYQFSNIVKMERAEAEQGMKIINDSIKRLKHGNDIKLMLRMAVTRLMAVHGDDKH